MKVKTADGTVREVKPGSIVGSRLRHCELGAVAWVDGVKYELVER